MNGSLNLEELQILMGEFEIKGSIGNENFMTHVLNKLTDVNDIIWDGFEHCLISNGPNALMIEVIGGKLNYKHENIKTKNEEKSKRKCTSSQWKTF